ncbi:hypothetical protein RND81_10G032200 [Saponaria officinalis]
MQRLTVAVSNFVLSRSLQGTFDMSKLPRNCLTALKLDHLVPVEQQVFDEIPEPNSQAPTNDLCPTQLPKLSWMSELQEEALPLTTHHLLGEIGEPDPFISREDTVVSGAQEVFDEMPVPDFILEMAQLEKTSQVEFGEEDEGFASVMVSTEVLNSSAVIDL